MQTAKIILLVIIIGCLLLSLAVIIPDPEPKDFVRFILTCVFCWFLYQGRNWARWVFGILLAVGGIGGAFMLFKLPVNEVTILLSFMSAFYLVSAGLLFFAKPLASYFTESSK